MKTLEFESLHLQPLSSNEVQHINGGFISFLSVSGVFKWLVGEIVDLGYGFRDGFNYMVK